MSGSSAPTVEEAIALLRSNPAGQVVLVADPLFTILKNASPRPADGQPAVLGAPKFRTLRRGNAKFAQSVGAMRGGVRLLRAAGFRDDETGESLVMPDDADPNLVQAAKAALKSLVKEANAEIERERAEENRKAGERLAELKRVQEKNSEKRNGEQQAERARVMRELAATRWEHERQRDPTNFG